MEKKFLKFNFQPIKTPFYFLQPLELKEYFDFEVKRVYFLYGLAGETGSHCHKKEEEFFFMAQGSCVAVIDEGSGLQKIKLDRQTGIYVGNYVWHHFQDFSTDAILVALSSTNYNPDRSDYIEDYAEFQEAIKRKN